MQRVDVFSPSRFAFPLVVTVAVGAIGGSTLLLAARGDSGDPVPPAAPVPPALPMTLAALADAVAEYRTGIDGLVVRYTVVPDVHVPGGYAELRNTLSRDGNRVRIERNFMLNEGGAVHHGSLVHAFDGTHAIQWNPREKIATKTTSVTQYREIGLELSGYADLLCWYGPHVNSQAGGPHPSDLMAVLGSAQTTLRPALETIGDRPCFVLDHVTPSGMTRVLWLDSDSPGLPLRQELRDSDGSILVTRTVEELVEIAGEQTLPKSGMVTIAPIGPIGVSNVLAGGRIERITLDDSAGDGAPPLALGVVFPEGHFACADLIAGTEAWLWDGETIEVLGQ